jgi:zinc protease
VELVKEVLLEPRWDEKEFARIKQQTIESIRRSKDNPTSVAGDVFGKLVYGRDHKLAQSVDGTESSIDSITIEDLKRYYKANLSPSVSHIAIAGDLSKAQALKVLKRVESWECKDVVSPELPKPKYLDKTQLYFVDFPDAKQSQLRIGHLALPYAHPDFFAGTVMNYKLGGSFNSTINTILREEKGYTYGARSSFSGSIYPGLFEASSSVRSTATQDSVRIVRDVLSNYRKGISEQDLQFTKDALIKSNTRRFETLGALVGMLDQIATYNLPFDYIKQEERTVLAMTLDGHRRLAQQCIQPDKMIYLVVGDAKTQMQGLKELGLGAPILLDKEANVINE